MFKLSFVLFLLASSSVLAFPYDGYPKHPGGIGGIFKGPNSETIIKGPDGSVITSEAEGGEVDVPPKAVPVVVEKKEVLVEAVVPIATKTETAVIVEQPIVKTAPVVVPVAAPVLLEEKIVAVETPEGADLVGPSGIVSTRGGHSIVSGPASTSIDGKEVLTAVPIVQTVEKIAPVLIEKVVPEIPRIAHEIAQEVVSVGTKLVPEVLASLPVVKSPIKASISIQNPYHTIPIVEHVDERVPDGVPTLQIHNDNIATASYSQNVAVSNQQRVVPVVQNEYVVPNQQVPLLRNQVLNSKVLVDVPEAHEVLLPKIQANAQVSLPVLGKNAVLDGSVTTSGHDKVLLPNLPVLEPFLNGNLNVRLPQGVPKILPVQYGNKYVL